MLVMIANADSIIITIQILSSPDIYQYAFANATIVYKPKIIIMLAKLKKIYINIFLLFVLTLHPDRNFGIYLNVTYLRLVCVF